MAGRMAWAAAGVRILPIHDLVCDIGERVAADGVLAFRRPAQDADDSFPGI
jgi:hypothetical protein